MYVDLPRRRSSSGAGHSKFNLFRPPSSSPRSPLVSGRDPSKAGAQRPSQDAERPQRCTHHGTRRLFSSLIRRDVTFEPPAAKDLSTMMQGGCGRSPHAPHHHYNHGDVEWRGPEHRRVDASAVGYRMAWCLVWKCPIGIVDFTCRNTAVGRVPKQASSPQVRASYYVVYALILKYRH